MSKKNIKPNAEIMKKLQGFGIVSNTIDYVVEIDGVPEEFLPIFTVKSLSTQDTKYIKEQLDKYDEDDNKMSELMESIVRQHIVNWSNLYDLSTGEEFDYKTNDKGECDEEVYYMLPTGIRASILSFIYKLVGAFN